MPEIQVNRDMIIHGAATRLELDDVDLGPTLGPVIVRREVELIDITTDLGTVVDKFATRNQMFIEMELASSSIDNLLIAWGGTKQQVTDELTNEITSITLELDPKDASEETKKMVIEAPGTENFFRRYWFPNVVSLVQTQRSIQKGGIISVPVEFEVIKDPSLGLQQFGRIQEIINAAGINIWDGNDQSKAGATELAPFIVEVRDQDGSPLSGVTVNWLVTAGGGSLSDASVDTGANGRAQTTLTLGSTQGTNTVTATVMVDNVASISNIPASPTVGDIIHFTTTITAGIPSTIKDKDGTTTVALIGIGDEHRWDGTNWLKIWEGSNITKIASVSDIPASPTVGDIIRFTTTITTGIPSTIKGRDGTTTEALIGIGNEYRWDGGNWLRFEKYIATFNAISSGI